MQRERGEIVYLLYKNTSLNIGHQIAFSRAFTRHTEKYLAKCEPNLKTN